MAGMVMFASNLSSEIGLKFLLSPLNTNVVIRTACCSVGIVLPVYSTFKAIETRDQNEQHKWLLYWAAVESTGQENTRSSFKSSFFKNGVAILAQLLATSPNLIYNPAESGQSVQIAYGSFSIVEAFTDKFLYWFPLYYHVKFAFLVWLQLPSADGAKQLYMNHLRPFLMKHQARLDHILELFHGELAKFISTHQAEIQFAKALLARILSSVGIVLQPTQGRVVGTIEGPAEQVETSESEDES